MAGLKKKKKEKSGNPNIVLVIFLVFFFLVAIGLGVWGYYGYAGQEDLRRNQKTADTKEKVEKLGKRYYSMLYRELRSAMGEKYKLDEKELEALNVDRDDFAKDAAGGVFTNEGDKEAAKVLLEDLRKELGTAENGKDFKLALMKEIKDAKDEAKEWKAKTNAALAKNERNEDITKKYTTTQDEFHLKIQKRVGEENAAVLLLAKEKSEAFQKLGENNKALTAELTEKGDEISKLKEDADKLVKVYTRKINVLMADLKDREGATGGGGLTGRAGGDAFPLILDISPGKPLWDHPVGRITRVDLELRQVHINLGTAHGAKPELTFNVFGANVQGRAEKQLKGSIEIVKVVDANTSIARITSLYDGDGREIMMNLQTRGRLLRESEAPIRAGDLLFNLFWGTRVAVAGYVSITGDASDNPNEQKRQMDDFVSLLRRNGMQVDAFVDLTDGQIRGKLSSKTRYLIRGDDLRGSGAEKPAAAPKMGDDEKDKDDKDKKVKEPAAKDAPPNAERNDAINKSSLALRNDAKERGMLMISQENFATVIGYTRARNANSLEGRNFRPTLPYAGNPDSGVLVVRPRDDKGAEKAPEKAPEPDKN